MEMGYFPPFFGIGGALILLSFFGILWLWAKERMALKGSSTAAADLKTVWSRVHVNRSLVYLWDRQPAVFEFI